MNFISLTILLYGLAFCDCSYKGSYSKVIWDADKSIYTSAIIDLGEESIYSDFTSCSKKRNVLRLKGKVNNQGTFIGNIQHINAEIVILRCDKEGNVVENIMTTSYDGLFEFETTRDKEGYLVFMKKGEVKGARYDIKFFK